MKAQLNQPFATFQAGFTLIEAMVTLSILSILAAIAAPSFQKLINNWKIEKTISTLENTIQLSRSEAIKRGESIAIHPNENWSQGWFISKEIGNIILQSIEIEKNISIASNTNSMTFDRWGAMTTSYEFLASIQNQTDISPKKVCISRLGKVTSKTIGSPC